MTRHRLASGLTRVELLAVLIVLILMGSLFASIRVTRRYYSVQGHRATYVRGVVKALEYWAADNAGAYPLPSKIDANNATVTTLGPAKDTTANIVSVLIFNQLVIPEHLIDPAEPRNNIEAALKFRYSDPPAAVRPSEALWDPAFSADFTGQSPGNLSWAILQPAGGRRSKWRGDAHRSFTPLVSARGPEMSSITGTSDRPEPVYTDKESLHLRNGPWHGPVGWYDGHVEHLLSPFAQGSVSIDGVAQPPDALFLDESADTSHSNDFLGIFTTAGAMPGDFKAIWD